MTRSLTPLAQLQAVRKRYGTIDALACLDLSIHPGEVLALLGPNGAGKTTAISLMLGLQDADAGSVQLMGQSPHALAARRGIGVMLQTATLPDTSTVRELLQATQSYYPVPRTLDECARITGIGDLLGRRYAKLSGGQQRRVQFALAICGRPQLLFLDEPTTGLDIEARQALWRAIEMQVDEGCAVLLTTHYLEEAEQLADRVVVIDHGRIIAQGSVDEIRAHVDQRRIRCRSNITAVQASAWPGVRHAVLDGQHLLLTVDNSEPVLRRLMAEDAAVCDIEVTRAGLGEAFLALTRDASEPALEQAA